MGSHCGRDLVLKSVWYNTSQRTQRCFKKRAALPARRAEPRHPRGPRLKAIEAPNLGCAASWVRGDLLCVTSWLLAVAEQRGGRISLREERLSGLCRVPMGLQPAPRLVLEALPSLFSLYGQRVSNGVLQSPQEIKQ